jgi:hypothetical protein
VFFHDLFSLSMYEQSCELYSSCVFPRTTCFMSHEYFTSCAELLSNVTA